MGTTSSNLHSCEYSVIISFYLSRPARFIPLILTAVVWLGIIFIPNRISEKKDNNKEK